MKVITRTINKYYGYKVSEDPKIIFNKKLKKINLLLIIIKIIHAFYPRYS